MVQLFTNNAVGTLASGITDVQTSITLTSGQGALFPSPTGGDFFYLTIFQRSGGTEVNHEIVKVTARSTDTLTVTRAQEGTTNRAFDSLDPVELRVTAATLGTLNPGTLVLPQATSPAQTAEGDVVWDSDSDLLTVGTGAGRKTMVDTDTSQALSNKTLTAPTVGTAITYSTSQRQTVWVPAAAMINRNTNGPTPTAVELSTNKIMIRSFDFDQTTAEYVQFTLSMPKSWDESTVAAKFLWSSNVAGTDSVVWAIQAVAISNDDALDTAFGTAQSVTDAQTAQNDLMHTAETSAITIAGTPAAEDNVIFQVYRDASNGSDSLAGDARLHGVVVYYNIATSTDL